MSAPSDYFSTITIQDDRIQGITDKIQYAVVKGASSNNPIQNAATSVSTSSIVFNQPIPSETTLVDRRIMQFASHQSALASAGSSPSGSMTVPFTTRMNHSSPSSFSI